MLKLIGVCILNMTFRLFSVLCLLVEDGRLQISFLTAHYVIQILSNRSVLQSVNWHIYVEKVDKDVEVV